MISVTRVTGDPVKAVSAINPANGPENSVSNTNCFGYLKGQIICGVLCGEVLPGALT